MNMERSTLHKLAFVWGAMLITLIVMVVTNPPATTPQQSQFASPAQLGDVFGQVKQFMSDVQTNITPPKGLG